VSETNRFFGYGSLVNTDTHVYPNPQKATLSGWRRVWRRTKFRDIAFLSVFSDVSCQIDGLVADVPNADWDALDLRESGYDRHPADTDLGAVQVYSVPERNFLDGEKIIILSYLDVVVQGFLREFGEDGVQRFFETTDGWDAQIRDDRAGPIYPRAQVLSAAETALVDHWLARFRP